MVSLSGIRYYFKKLFSTNRNFLISSLVLSCFLYVICQLLIPISLNSQIIEVEILKGMSFREALSILNDKGLVRDKSLMLILGRLTGLDKKLKAGYYAFWDNEMPVTVLKTLLDGKVVEINVTIIEGETIWDIAEKLEPLEIMSAEEFFALNSDGEFLSSLDIDAPSLEGYLFPSTYKFPKGIEPKEVIKVMVGNLKKHFTEEMYARMESKGMTEHDILTLASIIEKEAVADLERPVISAVYHNRLKKNMKLQADPTAIYGVKDFRLGVTKKDLKRKTPYNTYRRKGLPPGPIAAAGFKSIIAALYPADVPYLFFVAKNGREHYFSSTFREHFNAIKKYRSRKYKNQRRNRAS